MTEVDEREGSTTAGRAAQRYAARIVLGTAIVGGFFGAVVMARTRPFQVRKCPLWVGKQMSDEHSAPRCDE